jgi:hypothetical protein
LYYTTGVTVDLERTAETWRYEPMVNLNELSSSYFSVYPNPVHEVLTIESGILMDAIEIFTLQGKKLEVDIKDQSIFLSAFQEGWYLLSVQFSDGSRRTLKIFKE